jgi:AraC-like DNA-binding protein
MTMSSEDAIERPQSGHARQVRLERLRRQRRGAVERVHVANVQDAIGSRRDSRGPAALFRPIDADDDAADFTTLRTKAPVRVTEPRPPTARCIDNEAAATDTAASVWRAVPRVINAALTAPFQHDGREATLQSQALSAMRAHGSGATPPSPDAPLSADELRGRKTFEDFCASCHGRDPCQQFTCGVRLTPSLDDEGAAERRRDVACVQYAARSRPQHRAFFTEPIVGSSPSMLLLEPGSSREAAPPVAASPLPVPGDALAVVHERSAALAEQLICVRNLHVEAHEVKTHLATPNDVFSITVYGCDGLDCGQDDEPRRSGVMVSTARTERAVFRSLGRGELIAATLTVKGFLGAFGAPMQGLRNCRIPLHDIAGLRVEQELLAVVRNAGSPADRVAALCAWLERRMLDEPYRGTPIERVGTAAGLLTRHSPAEAGIEHIAAALDVTRRQLERDFRHWVSVAPTEYARLARAQRAAAALQSGLRAAHVAAREGFSDQAHMTRSLREVFGITPTALAALAPNGTDERTRRALGGRVLMLPAALPLQAATPHA